MNDYQFLLLLYCLYIVAAFAIPEIHEKINKERKEAENNLKKDGTQMVKKTKS